MELKHTFTVPAGVEDTWQTFMDLDLVGGCFPGATVTEVNDEGFSGTVKVKLGPIALLYAGSGSFVERDDGTRRAVIAAKGKDKRGNGTAGATVTIQLAAEGEGATRADVTTDLTVTGKPAQFGRGVMQDVSDKLLQQFIGCVEGKLSPAEAAAPPAPAAEEPVPVTAAPGPQEGPRAGGPVTPEDARVDAATPADRLRPAPTPAQARTGSDAIDLGSTVGPALLRAYGAKLALAAVVLVVAWLVRRRRH
jgi:carbon monoxide dehydrogenase subunit G